MPRQLWCREFPGRNPRPVILAEDRVAVGYVADQGHGGSPGPVAAVCLGLDGGEVWSARDFAPKAALPGARFVGLGPDGRVHVLDADGQPCPVPREIADQRVREIAREGSRLHFETGSELLVTDLALSITRRIVLPAGMDVTRSRSFTGDGFVWVESDTLMISDAKGVARTLCAVPVELAEDAMDRFEEETGEPALGAGLLLEISIDEFNADPSLLVDALQDPGKQKRIDLGYRFGEYIWRTGLDLEEGVVFLANVRPPHVVMCIGLDGAARWCIYLDAGCCGGTPEALPNGSYVVSSGCGGVLSWITAAGYVLHRTDPPVAADLSGAYGNRFRVLPDSRCMVAHGYGVTAHGPDARVLWTWPHGTTDFEYDERRDVLFTTEWTERDGTKFIEIGAVTDLMSECS